MSTINCTYQEFRTSAGSFLKKANTEDLSLESLEAGNKCVILHYFGITDELTELQAHESMLLLEMCGEKVTNALMNELLEKIKCP